MIIICLKRNAIVRINNFSLFHISILILTLALVSCSSGNTKEYRIGSDGEKSNGSSNDNLKVVIQVPVAFSGDYLFTKKKAIDRVVRNLPNDLPETTKKIIKKNIHKKFLGLPEQVMKREELPVLPMKDLLSLYQKALGSAIDSTYGAVYYIHEHLSPEYETHHSSTYDVNLGDVVSGKNTMTTVVYKKSWEWTKNQYAVSLAKISMDVDLRINKINNHIQIETTINKVVEKQPIMFGLRQIADVKFDAPGFIDALKSAGRYFNYGLSLSKPDDPYNRAIEGAQFIVNTVVREWSHTKKTLENKQRMEAAEKEGLMKELEDEQRRVAAEKERSIKIRFTKDFRKQLKVGYDTHCGLVIELKSSIVKIQTMNGEHWIKRGQVFPPNYAPCRFFNGIYQDSWL